MVAAPVVVGLAYAALAAVGLAGPGSGSSPVSPERITRVMTEPAVLEGTLWTLWVAAASTALATLGGAAVAVVFRGSGRWDRAGRAAAILPLAVPHLVAALAALLILGQSGLLARLAFHLGWIAGPGAMPPLVMDRPGVGLILALTWKELPFMALIASSVLATRGSALEETARGLGAGQWDTLRRVTWPILWRGMLPGAAAVFTFVAGSYEAALLLAPSDPLALPLLTWERYADASLARRADAHVLALLGMVMATAVVVLHEWMTTRFRGEGR